MPVEIIISSNFAEVGARFEAAGAASHGILTAAFDAAAHTVGDTVVPILADATPKRSGALADSTTADVEVGGDEATITLTQPATSSDGIEYWQFVEFGRGDVYPVNKKALAGPGFGPVKHAGPARAQHYVEPAVEAMTGPIETVLAEAGRVAAHEIVSII